MSLLLLIGAGAGQGTKGRHDGVWDAKKYADYQKRLAARRKKLWDDEEEDKNRKLELRKELTRLYRGIPEEQKQIVSAAVHIPIAAKRADIDFGSILAILEGLSRNIASIQEYKNIVERERLRLEAEEEDELEIVLMAVL